MERSVCGVEVNARQDIKMLEIWLSNSEKSDPRMQDKLKNIYNSYKSRKYLIAVFVSGKDDLYNSTQELLSYNRRRNAEETVQQARRQQAVGIER